MVVVVLGSEMTLLLLLSLEQSVVTDAVMTEDILGTHTRM